METVKQQAQLKPKRVPTPRQRKGAKAVVENALLDKPKPLGEVLQKVGYGHIAEHPVRIVQSQGFKMALAEFGLTEELITTSLVEDIKAKPKARVKELSLGAEILGMKKKELEEPPKSNTITYINIFNPQTQADIKEIDDKIKARLTQLNVETN